MSKSVSMTYKQYDSFLDSLCRLYALEFSAWEKAKLELANLKHEKLLTGYRRRANDCFDRVTKAKRQIKKLSKIYYNFD